MEASKENKFNISISMDKVRDKTVLDFLKSKRNKSDYIRQMLYNLAINGFTSDSDVTPTSNRMPPDRQEALQGVNGLPSDNVVALNNLLLQVLSLISQGNLNLNTLNQGCFTPIVNHNINANNSNLNTATNSNNDDVCSEEELTIIPDSLIDNVMLSMKQFSETS